MNYKYGTRRNFRGTQTRKRKRERERDEQKNNENANMVLNKIRQV